MLEINKLYNEDCLDCMKRIDDKSIDCIITDLPYGVTACKWDDNIDIVELWMQYKRIIKPKGNICLFGSQPFTTKLISSNEKDFRYCWYWIKNQGTNFFHAKQMPIRKVEEICIFNKGIYNPQITDGHIPTSKAIGCSDGNVYYGTNKRNSEGGKTTRYPTNVLEFKCVDNYSRIHPSQKPVELIEYLIKTYTNEEELVLDSCAGSMTTAIASINTNRNYICIEKYKDIFEIGKNRVDKYLSEN